MKKIIQVIIVFITIIAWSLWTIWFPHLYIYSGWILYIWCLFTGIYFGMKNMPGVKFIFFTMAALSPMIEIIWGAIIGIDWNELFYPTKITDTACFNVLMSGWSYFVLIIVIPVFLFFLTKQVIKK